MKAAKRKKLQAAGWRIGSADEFLGRDRTAKPPSYQEMADLICELVETNIANLDGDGPFVKCFTFGTGRVPDHWHRAIALREALIDSRLAKRQYRDYDRKKVRPLRSHGG